MREFLGRPWGWAAAVPALCAVHCAVTPLLLLAVPTLALWRGMELALLGVSVMLAAVALGVGFRRHGRRAPLAVAGGGLVVWVVSASHLLHVVPELVTSMGGALVVAGALLWNSQLLCRSQVPACGCVVCEDEPDSVTARDAGPSPAPQGLRGPRPSAPLSATRPISTLSGQ